MDKFEVSEEQKEYLATLFHNQNMLIFGRAGTGKSVLALEAVKRQLAENSKSKILYLCSNKKFKGQMKDKIDSLKTNGSEVCVDTFKHCFGLNFHDSIKWNREKIIKQADYLYQFSLIIVDEAQELKSKYLYDIKLLANHSKFYIFVDEEQQIQNDDKVEKSQWQVNLEINNPIRLKKNYRNPKNIVELAQKLVPYESEPFYSREEANICIDYSETQELLFERILDFNKKHNDCQIITILSDAWSKHSSILNRLPDEVSKNWLTVKQCLGIESENIIVIVEDMFQKKINSLLYTALTRTLVDLKIIFYFGIDRFGRKYDDEKIKEFKASELNKLLLKFQTEKNDVL